MQAQHAAFPSILGKAATSLPWVILGGLVPIVLGAFIPKWSTRVIVTGVVTFVLKMLFGILWTLNYKIPKWHGVAIVCMGIVGIALAAGAPDLLGLIAKTEKKGDPGTFS